MLIYSFHTVHYWLLHCYLLLVAVVISIGDWISSSFDRCQCESLHLNAFTRTHIQPNIQTDRHTQCNRMMSIVIKMTAFCKTKEFERNWFSSFCCCDKWHEHQWNEHFDVIRLVLEFFSSFSIFFLFCFSLCILLLRLHRLFARARLQLIAFGCWNPFNGRHAMAKCQIWIEWSYLSYYSNIFIFHISIFIIISVYRWSQRWE